MKAFSLRVLLLLELGPFEVEVGLRGEVLLAEGLEGLGEVGFDAGDGVFGGEVGLDFSVVARDAIDFIEVNDGAVAHIEGLAAARKFGGGLKAELENDVDGGRVVFNRGFFDDIDARIFDVALQDEVVFRGSVDSLHLGAHGETGVVSGGFIAARKIDAVVLPENRRKIEVDFGKFGFEAVARTESAL